MMTTTGERDIGCYSVERILGSRLNEKNQLEYFIKWKDYPKWENSWQLATDLFSSKKSSANSIDVHPMGNVTQNTPLQKQGAKRFNAVEIVSTPKRARSNDTGSSNIKNNSGINIQTPTQVLSKPSFEVQNRSKSPQNDEQNQEIDRVEKLRKRKNRHEYLVKWKNRNDDDNNEINDSQWISREIMIKHPQKMLSFLESIVFFEKSKIT